jgi:transcription initiation factor TFIIB
MQTSDSFGELVSGGSNHERATAAVERAETDGRTCSEPGCDGRVVTAGHESYCVTCGAVVDETELHTGPTSAGRKQRDGGQTRWAREPTTVFRVDSGLRTTIGRNTDAKGNWLTNEQERRLSRLRTQHRRLTDRNDRLTEALRDVAGIGANLRLPHHVRVDAAGLVRAAKRHRLPCGRLSWEALAGGATLLASRARLDENRCPSPSEVARYTKATFERTCAAARKIRVGTNRLDLPPARPRAVDAVLRQTGTAFGAGALLETARVARALLDLADEARIGPGTSRVTMATAAVDRATLLLERRPLSRQALVDAASAVVVTSDSRISAYSLDLEDALTEEAPRATDWPVQWAREQTTSR